MEIYVKDKIVELANQFNEQHNVCEYPVPVVELCKKEGFAVVSTELPKGTFGAVVVQKDIIEGPNSNKVIAVAKGLTARQTRFQIAYELAAYILYHDPKSDDYLHKTEENKRRENDIALFARLILMPKDLVKKSLSALKRSVLCSEIPSTAAVYHIADNFAVPLIVADERLKELGLWW